MASGQLVKVTTSSGFRGCCNCETYGWSFEKKDVQQCQRCKGVTYCSKVTTCTAPDYILIYLIQICQLEHFNKVHRKHCKYFQGSKVKDSSLHDPYTCVACVNMRAMGKQNMTLKQDGFICIFEYQAYTSGVLQLQKNKKVGQNRSFLSL